MERTRADYVAPAPLFDRLVDLEPESTHEVRPLRALTLPDLYLSIQREVERVLNTRCPIPLHLLEERDLTVIEYGASDFLTARPSSETDQRLVQAHLVRVVEAFEPRLRDVRVTIKEHQPNQGLLLLELSGALRTEHLSEAVSFPVAVRTKELTDGI